MQQVNSLGSQIASLNQSIQAAELAGEQPNDLLDQRDILIDKLSALGNTTVASAPARPARSARSTSPSAARRSSPRTPRAPSTLPLTSLTSGQLAGMESVISLDQRPDDRLPDEAEHPRRARSRRATNTQSALGKDLNGNAGGAFFTVDARQRGGDDRGQTRRSSPRPALIAASTNGDPGDGSNALAIGESPAVGR